MTTAIHTSSVKEEEAILRDTVAQLMWGKAIEDPKSMRKIDMNAIIDEMHPRYNDLVDLLLMISRAIGRDEVADARYRIESFLEHYAETFFTTRRPDIIEALHFQAVRDKPF